MEREQQRSERPTALVYGVPADTISWRRQEAELLAAGYRAISIDRRGFEWCRQPLLGYDYDAFATDVTILLDRLGLDDCVLCEFTIGTAGEGRPWVAHGSDRVVSGSYVHFKVCFDDFWNVDILVPERISRRAPLGRDAEIPALPFEAPTERLPGVIGDLYFLNGSGPITGGEARSVAAGAR